MAVVSREGAERVGEIQRARILAAMLQTVAEHGAQGVTVARVVARAGVSRRTFYEQFGGCEECFLALFEDTLARARAVLTDALSAASSSSSSSSSSSLVWRERVRAGLGALLAFFDQEPAIARLLIVDALAAGSAVLERRALVVRELAVQIELGAVSRDGSGRGAKRSGPPGPLVAEGTIGAVSSVIHARLLDPRPRPLIELLNPLMSMIVLPYLGQRAAREELARPVPKPARHTAARRPGPKTAHRPAELPSDVGTPASADPLRNLNMRLTYRTIRVLSAIAQHPNASNRQIADIAGVHDQGQISKLLNRLERLQLIDNTNTHARTRPRHGERNAWTLTPTGHRIQHTLIAR